MPIPGSDREKQFLSEVAPAKKAQPEFLQEIKNPTHDVEQLDEQPKAKKSKAKRGRKKS
jgi:hypothetical protein